MNGRHLPFSAGIEALTSADLQAAYGAIRAVAGPSSEGAQRMIDAIADKTGVAPDDDAPITADAFARVVTDPRLRVQAIRVLVVTALIDGVPSRDVVARVQHFAKVADVQMPALRDLDLITRGHLIRARLSVLSRFWVRYMLRHTVRKRGLWFVIRMVATALGLIVDRRVRDVYVALRTLPASTLGRAYVDFLDREGLPLPGSRGAAPEIIIYHDLSHVLAGYGTDPASEIQTASFQGAYRDVDPFAMVLFPMLQFHLGIRMTLPAAEVGYFEPARVLDAIVRGSKMNRDLTDGTWDYRKALQEPLEGLRRRYNVPPIAA